MQVPFGGRRVSARATPNGGTCSGAGQDMAGPVKYGEDARRPDHGALPASVETPGHAVIPPAIILNMRDPE
jgi:hypothetical protein